MQVDAPTHYASDIRDWLDENFSARWIGRRGAIDSLSNKPGIKLEKTKDFILY